MSYSTTPRNRKPQRLFARHMKARAGSAALYTPARKFYRLLGRMWKMLMANSRRS